MSPRRALDMDQAEACDDTARLAVEGSPDLGELLRAAIARPMTPAQERAQRISFVYGNMGMSNPSVTREMVERAVDGQPAANENAPVRKPYKGQIYLDMDGVLADFDAAACKALGTDNSYKWEWIHGTKAFWNTLYANDNFFGDLPPMPDAMELFDAVKHLQPVVLTALPKTGAAEVDRQKRAWIDRYLGGGVPVITCQTHEKPDYCLPGDVLVDDRSVNRAKWQTRGGHYVLHVSAVDSINQMRELGVL